MPTIKIGRRAVAGLQPGEKTVTYWDEELAGFGIRVFPTGTRSWICEYRPGFGGRSTSKRRVTLGTADESMPPEAARLAAKTLLARVRLGADPAHEKSEARAAETVKEISDAWLSNHVSIKRKQRTFEFYRQVLQSHILPTFGSRRAVTVIRSEMLRLHGAIGRAGSPYAANHALAVCKALFNWAVRAGHLPDGHPNPCVAIDKFREQGRERFLSDAEIGRFSQALDLAESDGLPWREGRAASKHAPRQDNRKVVYDIYSCAAVRLLLLTGCRLREVLNLQWHEVDFERALLLLEDSKSGRKVVPLASPALSILSNLPRIGRYVIASSSAGTISEKPKADLQCKFACNTGPLRGDFASNSNPL